MTSNDEATKDGRMMKAKGGPLLHDYTAMDITCAGADKRQLEDSPLNTPDKGAPTETNKEASFESIMMAITRLNSRFDKQESGLEEVKSKIRENSTTICSLAKTLEFNAAEIKECKTKAAVLEEKVTSLIKEKCDLKKEVTLQEAHSRRWNLRSKGMKEKMNENIREDVIDLLKKVAPRMAGRMDGIVDVVHRVGKKEEKWTRSVIIRFVKRKDRDDIWDLTKNSAVCKEARVVFTEDLSEAVKQAREVLWRRIDEARKAGKRAYFRGPYGYRR